MNTYKFVNLTAVKTPRLAEVRISLPHGKLAAGITCVLENVVQLSDDTTYYEGVPAVGLDIAADRTIYELDPVSKAPTGRKMSMGELLNWVVSFGIVQFERQASEGAQDAFPVVDGSVAVKPLPIEAGTAEPAPVIKK